jgi:hypothetical protein
MLRPRSQPVYRLSQPVSREFAAIRVHSVLSSACFSEDGQRLASANQKIATLRVDAKAGFSHPAVETPR